jgi:hypothetical protein
LALFGVPPVTAPIESVAYKEGAEDERLPGMCSSPKVPDFGSISEVQAGSQISTKGFSSFNLLLKYDSDFARIRQIDGSHSPARFAHVVKERFQLSRIRNLYVVFITFHGLLFSVVNHALCH